MFQWRLIVKYLPVNFRSRWQTQLRRRPEPTSISSTSATWRKETMHRAVARVCLLRNSSETRQRKRRRSCRLKLPSWNQFLGSFSCCVKITTVIFRSVHFAWILKSKHYWRTRCEKISRSKIGGGWLLPLLLSNVTFELFEMTLLVVGSFQRLLTWALWSPPFDSDHYTAKGPSSTSSQLTHCHQMIASHFISLLCVFSCLWFYANFVPNVFICQSYLSLIVVGYRILVPE